MQYIPGIIAYFTAGYICCVSRVFIWRIAAHWSRIWVADASQSDSQVLSLTFITTLLLVLGIGVFVWSIANHINFKFTEKGLFANGAAGMAIAIAVGQNSWIDEMAASMTYAN
jgi:hypothetical protein